MDTEEKKLIVTVDEVVAYLESNLKRFADVMAYMNKWAEEMSVVIEGLQVKQEELKENNDNG